MSNQQQNAPLYVRIPQELHDALSEVKESTGISKSDYVTLVLTLTTKLIDSQMILEMYEEYMFSGSFSATIIKQNHTQAVA